ncbi:5-(carboxyamino)imidazole ribonucleotide mutase [Fodinibius roseus]|uniref:N5-carboxyaminoimidazole ribonucleotide mutase n=1 Tax=Fodinibius roseus TaxID=1194090 RepID=A0A1M4T013_9BACT|nr:5-(carboxyamino)imidazole ribonucleotide mutase [Fodinibius roseus]
MSDNQPAKVGVIMGSDSDWPTMKEACNILEEFDIPYEKKVVSAHRTPDMMANYGKEARSRGIRVIIAGAGGAAHLPGMTAAHTTLPVIGVPVKTSTLSGIDSLYSIVQMPPGVPVATVAIGKAGNAGLLAVRMLSMDDSRLAEKLRQYHQDMAEASKAKTKNLT